MGSDLLLSCSGCSSQIHRALREPSLRSFLVCFVCPINLLKVDENGRASIQSIDHSQMKGLDGNVVWPFPSTDSAWPAEFTHHFVCNILRIFRPSELKNFVDGLF